jgi:hypothetical protein
MARIDKGGHMDKPTGRAVTVGPRQKGKATKQLTFGVVVPAKPMGRPPKLEGERYRRLSLMVEPRVDQTLRRLADERFLGNLSRAVAWSIGLAAATLDGPLRGLQIPANPADAVPTATGLRR